MADITAIVLTKNEEQNIVRCLESVKNLCSRVCVVDSGSTDRTVELAKAHGADVYFHEFEYYARQFNWGIDNCNIDTKWVIRLDADEQFPPELCAEIEENMRLHDNDNVNGFTLEATYFFLGRALTHGSKKRKLMVFKNGKGRIEDRRRDAHTILSEGESISLKHNFLHYDFKDLDNFIARYNWYATREAMDYMDFKNGKKDASADDPEIQKKRAAADAREAERVAAAEEVAKQLKGKIITMSVKCGSQGRLYGSVTTAEVAECLKAQHGVEVDKRKIELSETIRSIGDVTATIRLYTGISTTMTVHVEPIAAK